MVRLTDHPNMTIAVYHGHKTITTLFFEKKIFFGKEAGGHILEQWPSLGLTR